jgi:hypothetical protein
MTAWRAVATQNFSPATTLHERLRHAGDNPDLHSVHFLRIAPDDLHGP